MGVGPRGPRGCRPAPVGPVYSPKRPDILGGARIPDPASHQAGASCLPLTAGKPSNWERGRPLNSRVCPFPWSPGCSPWSPKDPRQGGAGAAAGPCARPASPVSTDRRLSWTEPLWLRAEPRAPWLCARPAGVRPARGTAAQVI